MLLAPSNVANLKPYDNLRPLPRLTDPRGLFHSQVTFSNRYFRAYPAAVHWHTSKYVYAVESSKAGQWGLGRLFFFHTENWAVWRGKAKSQWGWRWGTVNHVSNNGPPESRKKYVPHRAEQRKAGLTSINEHNESRPKSKNDVGVVLLSACLSRHLYRFFFYLILLAHFCTRSARRSTRTIGYTKNLHIPLLNAPSIQHTSDYRVLTVRSCFIK